MFCYDSNSKFKIEQLLIGEADNSCSGKRQSRAQNSKFKIEQLLIGEADNSKFKIQNSKFV